MIQTLKISETLPSTKVSKQSLKDLEVFILQKLPKLLCLNESTIKTDYYLKLTEVNKEIDLKSIDDYHLPLFSDTIKSVKQGAKFNLNEGEEKISIEIIFAKTKLYSELKIEIRAQMRIPKHLDQ